VVHAVTVGFATRGGLLAATYALTFITGLPLAVLAAIGLADFFFDFRARMSGRVPPST
jgi:hypothetical protein